jgi:hypothetical protein
MKRNRLPDSLADALPLRHADAHRADLTDAERDERMGIAVHEAAHFVAACRLGLPILSAFVRVPRKQPNAGFAGALGAVAAGGTLIQDAVFAYAAVIAQQFLRANKEQAEIACSDDEATFRKWADWTGDWETGRREPLSREDEYVFCDAVSLMVRENWRVIDAVAACLLHCSDSAGVLSTALTARLAALVRDSPPDISRTSEFTDPAAVCEHLRIEGPQIRISKDYPYVRVYAPPDYMSPMLSLA